MPWMPLRGAACAVLLLILSIPAAQAQLTPDRLGELIEQERYDEAWALAREHRAELEGEIMFDFLYGVAAVNSGNLAEGVFALERVVMRRPGFTRARLELARAYFLRGEDIRASHHFEIARTQDPPPQVLAAIERYQQRIRARADRYTTTVTGYVEAALGSDSNVNAATDADSVEFLFLGIPVEAELDDDAREKDDLYLRTTGQVRVSRPIGPDQTVFVRGNADLRAHDDESDFDTTRGGVRVGTTYHGEIIQTTVSARTQRLYLDGDRYQNTNGVGLNFARALSARARGNLGLQYLRMRYPDQPNRDAELVLLSGGVSRTWQARWRPVTSVALFAGNERADENTEGARANTDRNLHGVNAALRLQLDPEWALTTRAQYRRSEYGADHSLFDETREEDYYQLAVDLDWAPDARWRIGPSLQYSENDADIDLFEYDRTVFEVRARYSFY